LYEQISRMTEMRLQKYLASCGIGSRRTCETYITQGRIRVDGITVTELGTKIDAKNNRITFDNEPVRLEEKKWILLNKPPRYLCTMKDSKNRPIFSDLLPKDLGRLYPVGRLDYMSEGLLLVTNDGELAYRITHPRYEIDKTYLVTTTKSIEKEQMELMKKGVINDEELLRVRSILLANKTEKHFIYEIILKEGRYRHIRRVLKTFHIPIVRLKRTRIGPIALDETTKGTWRYLTNEEITLLKNATLKK
jgi:23S rRNA pseudouridine2605 synthase